MHTAIDNADLRKKDTLSHEPPSIGIHHDHVQVSSSHPTGSNPYIKRAYEQTTVQGTRTLYDEWANQYDEDLAAEEYAAPALAVQAVLNVIGLGNIRTASFLDAGCGTGLVGKVLAKHGASIIDGVDLSPGMLGMARRTGVYRSLEEADLSKPLEHQDESYDVVICVGTLTRAHVGPEVLSEFARVVRKDGLVVATVLADIWESGGYKAEVDQLVESTKVKVMHLETIGYRISSNVGGLLFVIKRL